MISIKIKSMIALAITPVIPIDKYFKYLTSNLSFFLKLKKAFKTKL